MKKVLIIMGDHSPNPSSVAICVEPLINKMISNGFEIDIVTERDSVKTRKYEVINNINVYRVDDYHRMNTNIMNELRKVNSAKILKVITWLCTIFLKGCYYLRYCIFTKEKQTAGWLDKEIIDKCVELYNNRKYDAVISISHPFKSHYIAEKLTQLVSEPIKWFMFEFDPFSYNKEVTKSKSRRKTLFKDEYNLFQACDKIFLTPELYRFYQKTPFNVFLDKFSAISFANMQPIKYKKEATEIKLNHKKINCTFTGSLYESIRNPSYALKVFSLLNNDIHLNFLTNFTREQIEKDITNLKEKFSVFPLQARNVALNVLIESDILINIGNTVEFQIPGKIFEYMSTGKPIIHFSKFSDDPALIYFKRYPKVLIVKEWEGNIKEQAIKIDRFCRNNQGINFSYEDICTFLKEFDGNSISNEFVNTINTLLEEK